MQTEIVEVATPEGPGRLFVDAVPPGTRRRATLVLGHGAGGGVTAADLELLARRLPADGITVVRFEQPWRTAGRQVAVPPPRLDVGWRAAIPAVLATVRRRAGCCCSAAAAPEPGWRAGPRPEFAVAGIVCLAFPLHLPGRPEKSRLAELLTPTVPRLVLQGTQDSFGRPAEIRSGLPPDSGVVAGGAARAPTTATGCPRDRRSPRPSSAPRSWPR